MSHETDQTIIMYNYKSSLVNVWLLIHLEPGTKTFTLSQASKQSFRNHLKQTKLLFPVYWNVALMYPCCKLPLKLCFKWTCLYGSLLRTISENNKKNNSFFRIVWDVCSYFLRGGSGESLGATPRATEARNSCLFCWTRRAALIILWHGVLRYGRLTFWARSSTTISRSVWQKIKMTTHSQSWGWKMGFAIQIQLAL